MNNLGDNLPKNPKKKIEENINRKIPILDRDPQFYNNVPLPSWIELSLIDVCNRSCSFCPKSDENIAPDTFQKAERVLIDKLYMDLKNINYNGAFTLCGYGEPLLYTDLEYLVKSLSRLGSIECTLSSTESHLKSTLFRSICLISLLGDNRVIIIKLSESGICLEKLSKICLTDDEIRVPTLPVFGILIIMLNSPR